MSRVAGRWRDPLVGRDVLVGTMVGVVVAAIITLTAADGKVAVLDLAALAGIRQQAAAMALAVTASIFRSFSLLLLALLLLMAVKRRPVAGMLAGALMGVAIAVQQPVPAPVVVLGFTLGFMAHGWCLVRYGYVCLAAAMFANWMVAIHPVTHDLGLWYAGSWLAAAAILAGLSVWAYRQALAGRRLLGEDWMG